MSKPLELQKLPEMPMQGPVEVSMKVYCKHEGKAGSITFVCPPGVLPDTAMLRKMLDDSLTTDKDDTLPEGMRLMTKPEFVAHITKRETGQEMTVPGCQDWEPEATPSTEGSN